MSGDALLSAAHQIEIVVKSLRHSAAAIDAGAAQDAALTGRALDLVAHVVVFGYPAQGADGVTTDDVEGMGLDAAVEYAWDRMAEAQGVNL